MMDWSLILEDGAGELERIGQIRAGRLGVARAARPSL